MRLNINNIVSFIPFKQPILKKDIYLQTFCKLLYFYSLFIFDQFLYFLAYKSHFMMFKSPQQNPVKCIILNLTEYNKYT